jgi:hypothetical protein
MGADDDARGYLAAAVGTGTLSPPERQADDRRQGDCGRVQGDELRRRRTKQCARFSDTMGVDGDDKNPATEISRSAPRCKSARVVVCAARAKAEMPSAVLDGMAMIWATWSERLPGLPAAVLPVEGNRR